jgi:HSP20 family protein
MAIVRWDPFRELETLQGRMGRLFEEAVSRPGERDLGVQGWAPAVNIYEDENQIEVTAELPGIEEKDININIENNVLTLKGDKKIHREEKKGNYHLVETSYGVFSRSFTLPGTVDQEKISASSENGVLKIVLPKKEETKPKSISVKVGKK